MGIVPVLRRAALRARVAGNRLRQFSGWPPTWCWRRSATSSTICRSSSPSSSLAILARDLAAGRRFADGRVRFTLTALAALIIGPGLIVNVFLKEYWGRPRPASTDLFGGTLPFVPAGEWSNACPDNCSFVSGEASSIFWLVCLIPLWPKRSRGKAAVVICAIAVLTAGLRVAFGGHYLSDVVLGGLSTLIVFAALAVLVERAYDASRQG